MQTINRNGWVFQIQDNGEAILSECAHGTPILTLPDCVDGHPLTGIEYDAFDHSGPIEAFRTSPEHPAFTVVNGVLFDRNLERLIRYPAHRDGDEYMVPAGTRVIAAGAFADADLVKRVIVPEGTSAVEMRAFAECPALEEVVLPASLNRFGHEVFSNCTSLREVRIPASHAFLKREDCFLIDRKENALLACLAGGGETELVAPEGIRYVDDYAFRGCNQLQKIRFHHGLRTLGRYAFYHCRGLKNVELQEGLRSIGSRAFSGCSQMRTLFIPDSVTSIEYKAFNNCDKLVLLVNKGSYAARYCRQFNFPCRHHIQWPWQK